MRLSLLLMASDNMGSVDALCMDRCADGWMMWEEKNRAESRALHQQVS